MRMMTRLRTATRMMTTWVDAHSLVVATAGATAGATRRVGAAARLATAAGIDTVGVQAAGLPVTALGRTTTLGWAADTVLMPPRWAPGSSVACHSPSLRLRSQAPIPQPANPRTPRPSPITTQPATAGIRQARPRGSSVACPFPSPSLQSRAPIPQPVRSKAPRRSRITAHTTALAAPIHQAWARGSSVACPFPSPSLQNRAPIPQPVRSKTPRRSRITAHTTAAPIHQAWARGSSVASRWAHLLEQQGRLPRCPSPQRLWSLSTLPRTGRRVGLSSRLGGHPSAWQEEASWAQQRKMPLRQLLLGGCVLRVQYMMRSRTRRLLVL